MSEVIEAEKLKQIGIINFWIVFNVKACIVIKNQILQYYVKFTENKKNCNYFSSEDYA